MRAANVVTGTDNCVQDTNSLTTPSLDDGHISLLAKEYFAYLLIKLLLLPPLHRQHPLLSICLSPRAWIIDSGVSNHTTGTTSTLGTYFPSFTILLSKWLMGVL